MRWKYPFQPPVGAVSDTDDGVTDVRKREERRRERDEVSHKPVAKPRVKVLTASKKLKKINIFVKRDVYSLFCKLTIDAAAEERHQRSAERGVLSNTCKHIAEE